MCDHTCDCGFNCSDEANCFSTTAGPCTQFLCDLVLSSHRKCLNYSRVCDGVQDCFDNTDESPEKCSTTSVLESSTPLPRTDTFLFKTKFLFYLFEKIQQKKAHICEMSNLTSIDDLLINGKEVENIQNYISYIFSNSSDETVLIEKNDIGTLKLEFFTAITIFRVIFESSRDLNVTVQVDDQDEIVTKINSFKIDRLIKISIFKKF